MLNVRVNREERRVKQRTWYNIGCIMIYTDSSVYSLYDIHLSYIALASMSRLCFVSKSTIRHMNIKPSLANILGYCNLDGLSIV